MTASAKTLRPEDAFDETDEFFQDVFKDIERKPKETILSLAGHLDQIIEAHKENVDLAMGKAFFILGRVFNFIINMEPIPGDYFISLIAIIKLTIQKKSQENNHFRFSIYNSILNLKEAILQFHIGKGNPEELGNKIIKSIETIHNMRANLYYLRYAGSTLDRLFSEKGKDINPNLIVKWSNRCLDMLDKIEKKSDWDLKLIIRMRLHRLNADMNNENENAKALCGAVDAVQHHQDPEMKLDISYAARFLGSHYQRARYPKNHNELSLKYYTLAMNTCRAAKYLEQKKQVWADSELVEFSRMAQLIADVVELKKLHVGSPLVDLKQAIGEIGEGLKYFKAASIEKFLEADETSLLVKTRLQKLQTHLLTCCQKQAEASKAIKVHDAKLESEKKDEAKKPEEIVEKAKQEQQPPAAKKKKKKNKRLVELSPDEQLKREISRLEEDVLSWKGKINNPTMWDNANRFIETIYHGKQEKIEQEKKNFFDQCKLVEAKANPGNDLAAQKQALEKKVSDLQKKWSDVEKAFQQLKQAYFDKLQQTEQAKPEALQEYQKIKPDPKPSRRGPRFFDDTVVVTQAKTKEKPKQPEKKELSAQQKQNQAHIDLIAMRGGFERAVPQKPVKSDVKEAPVSKVEEKATQADTPKPEPVQIYQPTESPAESPAQQQPEISLLRLPSLFLANNGNAIWDQQFDFQGWNNAPRKGFV